ncbi:MAG: alpha/beta hydrolase-fold protein [Parashewanella sp.]
MYQCIKFIISILVLGNITFNCLADSKVQREFNHQLKSDIKEANITVYLPEDYHQSQQQYSVLYTTAGNRRFELMKAILDWHTHVDWSPIPPLILVSVPTITDGKKQNKYDGASGKFNLATTQWLKTALLPFIKANYRAAGKQILEGFSSYGNLPIYVYQKQPQLFDAYISLSPALSLDKSGLIENFTTKKMKNNKQLYADKPLFLSLGSIGQDQKQYQKLTSTLMPLSNYTQITFADDSNNYYLQPPITRFTLTLEHYFKKITPLAD